MNPDKFVAATGSTKEWAAVLIPAMHLHDISTPIRQAHFLAQFGHETGGFKRLVENLNYSAEGLLATWSSRFNPSTAEAMARNPEMIANHVYGGRLGNVNEGDGWKYRGRGGFQLTGRENYRKAGQAIGLPLEAEPWLAEGLEAASLTATWYWVDRGLNSMADADDLIAVTRRINGGLHGIDDRLTRLHRAKKALGL